MIAVVKLAGKQHLVKENAVIEVEAKIESKDKKVVLGDVIFVGDGEKIEVGKPQVKDAKVEAEVVFEGKSDKILVVKHHPKKRFRRTKGHRQDITKLKIVKIKTK